MTEVDGAGPAGTPAGSPDGARTVRDRRGDQTAKGL
jgi:hypothetical protein